MRGFISLILSTFLLFGCGNAPDGNVETSVEMAQMLLSNGKCLESAKLLEQNSEGKNNAKFLRTLSNSYACLSGFKIANFFEVDFLTFDFASDGLNGLSRFSLPKQFENSISISDEKFQYLNKAIDTLLYVGDINKSTNPTLELRSKYFNQKDFLHINEYIAFLSLNQLGIYLKKFGNMNELGQKGEGTLSNKCFTSYNLIAPFGLEFSQDATGSCNDPNTQGHNDLNFNAQPSQYLKNACYGMVSINRSLLYIEEFVKHLEDPDLKLAFESLSQIRLDMENMLVTIDPELEGITEIVSLDSCTNNEKLTPRFWQLFFYYAFESMTK